MTAAPTGLLAVPQLLAHVGPLGQHDLLVIIPMAVLSALILVVMARPKRPAPGEAEPPPQRPTPGEAEPPPQQPQPGGAPADRTGTPTDRW